MFKRKGKVIAKTLEELAIKEKIRLENISARAYANSIRKVPVKEKPNYGFNGKLSFNIVGIYFLRYCGNIVYVGESNCIMSRLVQHQKEGKKVFDSWTWKHFNGSDMQRKTHEKNLIKILMPKYNDVHNPKSKNKVKRKSKSVYLVLSK